MAVITFANFKGGTGKTINTCLTAYALAEQGHKVLIVDKDPQANATTILIRSYRNIYNESPVMPNYLMDGLKLGEFTSCILEVTSNLHLIPNKPQIEEYDDILEDLFPGTRRQRKSDRIAYFGSLLNEIKNDYDYVFIDVPPTISTFTHAALYTSDFVVISLQTQDFSLDGADVFVEYMVQHVNAYNLNLEVLGVLCVILNTSSKIDPEVIKDAEALFGKEYLFETQIKHMERVKRFVREGILVVDHHDKNVMKVYDALTKEILERMEVLV